MTVSRPRCGNRDHPECPAAAHTMWPDGRFLDSFSCRSCTATLISLYVLGDDDGQRHPLLITPLTEGDDSEWAVTIRRLTTAGMVTLAELIADDLRAVLIAALAALTEGEGADG